MVLVGCPLLLGCPRAAGLSLAAGLPLDVGLPLAAGLSLAAAFGLPLATGLPLDVGLPFAAGLLGRHFLPPALASDPRDMLDWPLLLDCPLPEARPDAPGPPPWVLAGPFLLGCTLLLRCPFLQV